MTTKILKKGNSFVAYNEKGDSTGRINIKTEKFTGATVCMMELHEHLEKYLKEQKDLKLIDKRHWSASVNVKIPILKDLEDDGMPLNIGSVTLTSGKRNFILDASETNFDNEQKAGTFIEFSSDLEIDFETFPIDEENNYCLKYSEILDKTAKALFYCSDCDAGIDNAFDYDNAEATITFSFYGNEVVLPVELEQ